MDSELRNNVRQRWLETLFEFTDMAFQRRLWLGYYTAIISSYTEAICKYFDDLDLDEGYERFVREGFATAAEAAIVMPFHEALRCYTNNAAKRGFEYKEVLNDPDWHEVVGFGFAVWQALKAHLNDNQEYEFMQQLENKYL